MMDHDQNIFVQKHMLIELTVINNYIKYSFYSINLVLSGVSIDSLLLSPYMITDQLVVSNTQKDLPLLSFYHQITQCCDGIVCHLHGYEQVPFIHFLLLSSTFPLQSCISIAIH